MASVRMSSELRTSIFEEAKKKFLLADPRPTANPVLADIVTDALLDHPAYKAAYAFVSNPDIVALAHSNYVSTFHNYLTNFRRTEVVRAVQLEGFVFNGKSKVFKIEYSTPRTMHFGQQYGGIMVVNLNHFDAAQRNKLEVDLLAAAQAELDWDKRYEEYTTKISNLIAACNTVKQLLDAWPAAEQLLPPVTLAKLNEVKKSTADEQAAKARAAFNPDDVNSTVLIAGLLADVKPAQGSV